MTKKNKKKEIIYRVGAIIIALALWQIAAMTVGMDILLVSPVKVIARLFTIWLEDNFFGTVFYSLLRITTGLLIAIVLGFILAIVSGKFKIAEYLLWPYVVTVKAVPVASFIIMSLIWLNYSQLTIFISFLIVFPVIYSNILTGIKSTDPALLEMADIFRLPYNKRFKYIYLPSIQPYFKSSCIISVGMAFKAGVAAEVIGVVSNSIGGKLYESKIYFNSADLFAWTIIIVVLSVILEKLFSKAADMIFTNAAKSRHSEEILTSAKSFHIPHEHAREIMNAPEIRISGLSKSYGDKKVFNKLELTIPAGKVTCINGASGCGKTTLFRMLCGLTAPDEGTITGVIEGNRIGYVFQEDRLCEDFSVIDNVALVCDVRANNRTVNDRRMSNKEIMAHLSALGLENEANSKVSSLSGGMKRRVAIARAICYDAPLLLLDEPFKGLDPELKETVMNYVLKETTGRTVICVTHDHSEAVSMAGDNIIMLDELLNC